MKKIPKLMASLLSLLFVCVVGGGYLTSCSSGSDDDDAPSLTISTDSAIAVDAGAKIDVTVTATLKNDTFAGAIPADTNLAEYVTVTPSSTTSFADDLSVKAAEAIAAGSTTAKVKISVTTTAEAVSGTIKVTIKAKALKSGKDLTSNALAYKINSGEEGAVVPTVASWDFTTYAAAEWTGDGTADGHAGSKIKKDEASKNGTTQYLYDGQYYLTEDISLENGNAVMTLSKTGTGVGNTKLTAGKEQPYSYKYGANAGLRIKNDAIKIADVKGNVVLKIEWSSMQNKEAGNRKLEVTVGDNGTTIDTATTATGAAEDGMESVAQTDFTKEISAGSGTNIYIGCSNNIFVKTISISAQSGSFTATTNTDTTNDEATLGLVGTTVESSDSTVATAEISEGKIKITSVKAGSATITVKDADAHEATIAVTVSASGNIELGTVTKYAAPSTTYTLDLAAVMAAGKVGGTTKKIDDTISIVANKSDKSIQGYATYIAMTGGSVNVTSGTEYGIQVTLTGAATVTIKALSKEGKEACQWKMKGLNGASDAESTGTPAVAAASKDVTTKAPATLTFTNVAAGTYILGAASDGGYLTELVIQY